MGAVDLVVQIESPEVGRPRPAAHRPGGPRRRRGQPRADLPEVPRRPAGVRGRRAPHARRPDRADGRAAQRLDVLAQQIVAIAVAAEEPDGEAGRTRRSPGSPSTSCTRWFGAPTPTPSSRASCWRTCWTCSTGAIRRGSSPICARASCGIASRGRSARARARASSRSRTRARSPTGACIAVTLPDGRRVGELDEEMVYEARPGQVFLLGASTLADRGDRPRPRDRHPGAGRAGSGPVLEGRHGRAAEGARRGDRRLLPLGGRAGCRQTLEREYDLDERAAAQPARLPARAAARRRGCCRASGRSSLERFRDEIGDWRLCVLSPYGGRVHAAWGLALSARIHERFGVERGRDLVGRRDRAAPAGPRRRTRSSAAARLGRGAACCWTPMRSRQAIVAELGGSALFGARFRENAARALLIPRAYPGRRTPLWQQRLKAQSLLEVARRYEDFPIVLETYRECLRDVLDLTGLQELLRGPALARDLAGRGRDARPPRRSPPRCCSTTSRPTCTRATRRAPSAGRRRCRSTATCCASCSARRSCAS